MRDYAETAMPLPTIAGTVRATFRGSNVAGQQWANVMHFQYAGGASSPGTSEINALDAKLLRLYSGTAYTTGAPWLTLCSPDTKLIDASYYPLSVTGSAQVIAHSQIGTGGANSNQPAEVAHVLTLRTGTRGRRYRGRIYLPAVTVLNMAGASGTMTSTSMANFLTQARGLLADLASIQWAWGVASYGHGTVGGQPSTWTPFFTALTDVTMDAVPDVQRRRKQ